MDFAYWDLFSSLEELQREFPDIGDKPGWYISKNIALVLNKDNGWTIFVWDHDPRAEIMKQLQLPQFNISET